MRVIGMDVHRSMAVIAVVEGNRLSRGGRIDLTRDAVIKFGRKLRSDDEVVIEATVNTAMIVRLLRPSVRRVVIANPLCLVGGGGLGSRARARANASFLRAYSEQTRQAVAAVATAGKIAVLAWHLLTNDENYAWARPALLNAKLRKMELRWPAHGKRPSSGPRTCL